MKEPYYKVYIDKRDISLYVESINYEDSSEIDNLITLEIDQNYALRLADDEDFTTGRFITFQFGFLQGAVSELHKARITDITHKYRERVSMTVKCLDLGTTIKKTTSQKIWKGKTSSEIAKEIADSYGMDSEITPTKKVLDSIPQGNKSDLEFLRYLAARESGGNFVTFIRNNTLYFSERGLKEESRVTFTYGDGNSTLVSFEPSIKESGQSAAGVKSLNTTTVVDNTTETKTGSTGSYKVYYGEDGSLAKKVAGTDTSKESVIGKRNTTAVKDGSEAANLANHSKKKANLKTLVAKLVVEGNPILTPNTVVTVKNVAKRHLGNWYITKITHAIKGQSYLSTMELSRNAGKSKAKDQAKTTDANNTVGANKAQEKVKVRVYKGEDGKFVGYSSKLQTAKKK